MKKTTWAIVIAVLILSVPLHASERKATKITSAVSPTHLNRIGTFITTKIFGSFSSQNAFSPLGGKGFIPGIGSGGPKVPPLQSPVPCSSDNDCTDNSYCLIENPGGPGSCQPPCHTGDCPEGFECDKGAQQDPNDNRCVPEKGTSGTCPPGQSPIGGNGGCQPDDDTSPTVTPPKGDASEIPEGCIYLKETHIAGHLVRIEYDFKAEIEGEGDIKVPCPSIDKAYVWGHMIQLNSSDTPLVIQQPFNSDGFDSDDYEINDPFNGFFNDPSKPAKPCNSNDDTVCMGYGDYRTQATKADSKVWTKHEPTTYGFDKFPFWRVEGLDLSPNGGFDDPEVLGYARIKFFYDEDLDTDGKPTHNFTPRIYMVVESQGKSFQIQGEVEILAPTATITVTTPKLTPQWQAAVHLNDGVFDDIVNEDTSKTFENAIASSVPCGAPSITAGNGSLTLKSGYAANITFNCPISEALSFTADMRGINHFDHLVKTLTYSLSKPTVTFKEIGCDQTLGGQPANNFSASCADVDEKGKIKLSYKVEGRKAELVGEPAPEQKSQGGGTFNGTVAENPPASEGGPPVVITVPWVGGVTISSEGKDSTTCKQDKKTITIVNTADGTKGPESDELSLSMPGIASGSVIMNRSYECYEYKIAVTGLDGEALDISVDPVKVPYTPLSDYSLQGYQCHETLIFKLPDMWDWYWCWPGVVCWPDTKEVYVYLGLDYTIQWKLQHIKEVSTTCEGVFFDAKTTQESKNISPTEYADAPEIVLFEGNTKEQAADCSFSITQYDGTEKTVTIKPPLDTTLPSETVMASPFCSKDDGSID